MRARRPAEKHPTNSWGRLERWERGSCKLTERKAATWGCKGRERVKGCNGCEEERLWGGDEDK
jgi:hypothetical protein